MDHAIRQAKVHSPMNPYMSTRKSEFAGATGDELRVTGFKQNGNSNQVEPRAERRIGETTRYCKMKNGG